MKKLLTLIFVLVLAAGCAVAESDLWQTAPYGNDYTFYYFPTEYGVEIDFLRCNLEPADWTPDMQTDMSIVIPDTLDGSPVISIMWNFLGAGDLLPARVTSVVLPDSLLLVHEGAFSWCPDLTQFIVSPNNPALEAVDGVLFDKRTNTLLRYPPAKAGESYNVPEGTTAIAQRAFYGCNKLTSIVLADSVTHVGDNAFSSCRNLTSLTLGRSLATLPLGLDPHRTDKNYLDILYSLTDVHVSPSNPLFSSIDGVLFNKDGTTLLYYPAGRFDDVYYIPEQLTGIDPNAFADCAKVPGFRLPDSYTFSEGEPRDILLVPCAMTDERMQAIKNNENMRKATLKKLSACYVMISPETLPHHLNEEEVVATYPILKEGATIWILKSNTTESNKRKIHTYFEEAGYTVDDVIYDNNQVMAVPPLLLPYTVICDQAPDAFLPESCTLVVPRGSLAEAWAYQNGFKVVYSD